MAVLHLAIACILVQLAIVQGGPNSYIENRIVGGDRVKYRQAFPYQISLRVHGQHICGGTIYKPHYVITAAHCLSGLKASQVEIVAGDLNLKTTTSYTQKIGVEAFTVHENYNDFTKNDVAVLKLKNDLKYNQFVQNITIWNATLPGIDNTNNNCVVSGWGAVAHHGSVISDLRCTNVTMFSVATCSKIYNNAFSPREMVCAGDLGVSRDACTGDSGGPLVCQGHLYGIVSWGIDCGIPAFPGVYTNASYYASWIEEHTNVANSIFPISSSTLFMLFILFNALL